MSRYTKEDILRMVEDEDVGFIRLQFTDVFGTMKNVAITASQMESALANSCSFDGSGIDGLEKDRNRCRGSVCGTAEFFSGGNGIFGRRWKH